MSDAIAIVGLACRYPDADDPRALWESVVARRRAFRRLPRERLNADDYVHPSDPDATYCDRAAVLEGWTFDRVAYRVSGSSYRAADPTHWLALDTAARALRDAGFTDGEGLPRATTGVLIGNSLTGEFSRAGLMRLRWPYVARVLAARLEAEGLDAESREALLAAFESDYKSAFPVLDEESLAGGLSNTIAGRICNHFDLGGGGYTVDGACSSSLLAVSNACRALADGELDVALAGGVDLSLDPFELVGFARTGALARDDMKVFERDAQGFWPGEGCGMVVLMREADALAFGARPYATILGWGVSSDGQGGITRPETSGQLRALRRAWRRAGRPLGEVTLFEAHGTGTSVGDSVELATLLEALDDAHRAGPAWVGSIKANIGHAKAAAGIAGLIKTTLALHHGVIPPMVGGERPHPLLEEAGDRLRVARRPLPWPRGRELLAGVSSFGFGGINVHIALRGVGARRADTATSFDSAQDAELFLFASESRDALRASLARIARQAARLSFAELTDLAAHLATQVVAGGAWRAAIVAATPEELDGALARLLDALEQGRDEILGPGGGSWLGHCVAPPRILFLFPGQASPARADGGALARRFAAVETLYRRAALDTGDGIATDAAQPAIVAAELAGLAALDALGIQARAALGHSLGELTALHWAGVLEGDDLLALARARGRAMSEVPGEAGGMLAVKASARRCAELVDGREGLHLSCLNGAERTVISGGKAQLDELLAELRAEGLDGVRLAVSDAFHSPRMAAAAERLREALDETRMASPMAPVYSTVTGGRLALDSDISELLVAQLTQPVRFTEALAEALEHIDLCIEVGPGRVLSGLVEDRPCVSLDAAGDALRPLLEALGLAFAMGAEPRVGELFRHRYYRPFDPDRELSFLASPCESVPARATPAVHREAPQGVPEQQAVEPMSDGDEDLLGFLRAAVARRAELPLEAVSADSRLLSDLHLNSITVGEIVAEAARRFDIPPPADPSAFADADIAAIATALDDIARLPEGGAEAMPIEGVAPWVRPFVVDWHPLDPVVAKEIPPPGRWRDFRADGGWLATDLALPGDGARVVMPADPGPAEARLLLEAARAWLADGAPGCFLLMQHTDGPGGDALARCLFLENPDARICVVESEDPETLGVDVLGAEIATLSGYRHLRIDARGRRWEQRLRGRAFDSRPRFEIGTEDVCLFSGGGKGIAAECALALARDSGCALILLGRSDPDTDEVLAGNLARFDEIGARVHYARADVRDAASVGRAVAEGVARFGEVSILVHAAGANQPRLVRDLKPAQLDASLRIKRDGLRHLLAAIRPEALRCLIGFGSVIARTGLPGEADYALANDWMAHDVTAFSTNHPKCRASTLEWSVWSGVGMGERLGRIEALTREGIAPMSVDQGVAAFRRALDNASMHGRVVLSGRFPEVATLALERPELPLLRFVETPRVWFPGVELVVDVNLSEGSDPYLAEHALNGVRLFPTVLALEAMAQVASALRGDGRRVTAFERIALARPIPVAADGDETLRIAALARDGDRVEVVLRCAGTNFQNDHFRALLRFDEIDGEVPGRPPPECRPLDLDPLRQIYPKLLFHQGRFRRVRAYRRLEAERCCVDIGPGDGQGWFGGLLPQTLLLGDPGARDACLHAIQACVPHARVLPVAVERVTLLRPAIEAPCVLEARQRWQRDDGFCYDLVVRDAGGEVVESWHGLELRRVETLNLDAWPEALLRPYLSRRAAELLPGVEADWRFDDDRSMADAERPSRRPDGRRRPTDGSHGYSAAHGGGRHLRVDGEPGLACDLEPVTSRRPELWRDLIGEQGESLARSIEQLAGEGYDQAATRLWTARECLKKAGMGFDAALRVEQVDDDGWVLLRAGDCTIASFVGAVEGDRDPLAFALLVGGREEAALG